MTMTAPEVDSIFQQLHYDSYAEIGPLEFVAIFWSKFPNLNAYFFNHFNQCVCW